jgi:hypothetical protein
LASAVEAAHHGALADAQARCGLLVGEAGDVHGHEDVAEVIRKRGDRRVELAGLERGCGSSACGSATRSSCRERAGTEPAALGPLLVQEGVAQRAQEIAEVVLVAEQARRGEQRAYVSWTRSSASSREPQSAQAAR